MEGPNKPVTVEIGGSAAPEVAKWVRANVQQMPVGGGEGTVLLALKRAVRQGLLQRAPGGRFLLPSADHLREGNQMLCQHCRSQRQKRNQYERMRRRKGGRKGSRRGSKGRGRRGRRCPDFADDIDSK
ncbi:Protein of unknown function [Gryllus bimaculatus]|nr:Protein of unknown function [Gryllus bimaculatus]